MNSEKFNRNTWKLRFQFILKHQGVTWFFRRYFCVSYGTKSAYHKRTCSVFYYEKITYVSFKIARPEHSIRFITGDRNICVLRHIIISRRVNIHIIVYFLLSFHRICSVQWLLNWISFSRWGQWTFRTWWKYEISWNWTGKLFSSPNYLIRS